MVACASGDVHKVEQMLEEGADPNYISDLGGTPLTWAVAWDREAVVECLLNSGAEVELPANPAWSPLMHAASRGNGAIVSILMAHGANPFRRDGNGQLPIDVAKETGRFDCAFLIEQLAMVTAEPIRCTSQSAPNRHGRRHGRFRHAS